MTVQERNDKVALENARAADPNYIGEGCSLTYADWKIKVLHLLKSDLDVRAIHQEQKRVQPWLSYYEKLYAPQAAINNYLGLEGR